MASGLRKVKEALGPDALILSTRTIKDKGIGLLGKPVFEITAAIDGSAPVSNYFDRGKKRGLPPTFSMESSPHLDHMVSDPVAHLLHHTTPPPATGTTGPGHSKPIPPAVSPNPSIRKEVDELKILVKGLTGQISFLSEKTSIIPGHSNYPGTVGDPVAAMLEKRGINIEASQTISAFLREDLTEQELASADAVSAKAIEAIKNLIEIEQPSFSSPNDQLRIALVGPTGVGKTTTLAKIAASFSASHSGSIALITIDTYRIAAVEQLKVYGEIMHLPVDVVITPDQLRQAIERHQDKDLILIDTAGRSPEDGFCIEELSTFLNPDLNIDKHLVLSAATRENELLNIINQFQQLGLKNTIFTKVDECINLGILLNIQLQNSFPLSYITNGQRVPEDIIEPSQQTVAELIMREHQGNLYD